MKKSKFLFNGTLLAIIISITLFQANSIDSVAYSEDCLTKPYHSLNITPVAQEADLWCWAASIQMLIKKIKGQDVSQCSIATERVRLHTPSVRKDAACKCRKTQNECKYPACERFNRALPNLLYNTTAPNKCKINPKPSLDTLKALLEIYGLQATPIPRNTNTLNTIKRYLCSGIPIIAFLAKARYTSHIVVVNGFQMIGSTTHLIINNPLYNTTANCRYCVHVIGIDNLGDNLLSNNADDNQAGTYCVLAYLAINKMPPPITTHSSNKGKFYL